MMSLYLDLFGYLAACIYLITLEFTEDGSEDAFRLVLASKIFYHLPMSSDYPSGGRMKKDRLH